MHYTYLFAAVILIVLAAIIIEEYTRSHCSSCGAKMDHYYDIEEDCEVYQCPNCGRSYIKWSYETQWNHHLHRSEWNHRRSGRKHRCYYHGSGHYRHTQCQGVRLSQWRHSPSWIHDSKPDGPEWRVPQPHSRCGSALFPPSQSYEWYRLH